MGKGTTVCISGIDTDIGKTVVTGLLGRFLKDHDFSVITQKICQTGCAGTSEDIVTHRHLMGMELTTEDHDGTTCPYVFSEPCSPHLAAALDGRSIDSEILTQATRQLQEQYEVVLLEGAGGLLVPLTLDYTLLDHLDDQNIPIILVTSSRLGSINHTLSSLEILCAREVELLGLVYNHFHDSHRAIAEDSFKVFQHYLQRYGFERKIVEVEILKNNEGQKLPDFSCFSDNFRKL